MKKLITLLVLILALALLATGCKTDEATPEVVPPDVVPTEVPPDIVEDTEVPVVEDEPVVLRVGGTADIDCWHPYACAYIWDFGDIIFEGFQGKGSWETGCAGVPRLAKSIVNSEDGLTWTIELHEGIVYSDGTPMTAQTAVDFINWMVSTDIIYWYYELTYMTSIEALDDTTLQFTTEYPISNFPDMDAVWMWIMAPHFWEQYDNASMWTYDGSDPIGTGPYQLTDYKPGEFMIFDAIENYYQGKPPVDRIIYQLYSNADAVIQALIAGEIDMTSKDLTPQYYDILAAEENITVIETPPGSDHFLSFNVYPMGTKHPAIDDPIVREAIDHAINRDQIVEIALLGHGVVCPNNYACGPAWEDVLNPDLEVTPYDPEYSMQILEEAGYVDTDGDGVRETPDGEPLVFRLNFAAEFAADVTMSDLLTQWLRVIGIQVEPEALELGTQTVFVMGERDYDMAILYTTTDIDPGYLDFSMACWAADAGTSAWNFAGYCNEEFDNLVFEYMTTPDREARWVPMFKAQAMINNDRPFLILAGENITQAYRNDRFEFPHDFCGEGNGAWSYPSILNVEVK